MYLHRNRLLSCKVLGPEDSPTPYIFLKGKNDVAREGLHMMIHYRYSSGNALFQGFLLTCHSCHFLYLYT